MKKVYDRKKKQWITQEEHDRRYSKRPKNVCRGGRPHDFVLVLPSWVRTNERYNLDPLPYYEAQEAARAFQERMSNELADRGIMVSRYHGLGSGMRHYVCSVCKKQEYKDAPEGA